MLKCSERGRGREDGTRQTLLVCRGEDRACGIFWEGEEGKREGVIAPFLWQLSDVGARQPYPKYDMGRQGRERQVERGRCSRRTKRIFLMNRELCSEGVYPVSTSSRHNPFLPAVAGLQVAISCFILIFCENVKNSENLA